MSKKKYILLLSICFAIGLVLGFELIRDSFKTGDFIGYVNAGNLVLNNQDIYSDYLNTWPPLFSIFSVILAFGDVISPFIVRFIWLFGSLIAMYLIIQITLKLVFGKTFSFNNFDKNKIRFYEPIVVIPVLLSIKYIMDNLANVQINIYLLLCSILSIYFFVKQKYLYVGLFLGLSISLKVFPIFILFFLIYKNAWKPVLYTFVFIVLFNSISFLVFGFDKAIHYYSFWASEVAPKSLLANHKNQSLFGMFLRYFTTERTDTSYFVNFLNISAESVKAFTYLVIALFAIYPAFLIFKMKGEYSSKNKQMALLLQFSFVLTAIPIISPLAWKAYFIFLWTGYFFAYLFIFRFSNQLNPFLIKILKVLFWSSVFLMIISMQAIVGWDFSDYLEMHSAITISTIFLLLIQLILIKHLERFDTASLKLMEYSKA